MPDPHDIPEFTKYYEQYKNAIFSYILYRISFDRETAEDLTSEIFFKAYRAFDRYDRARPFKTWIYTIAHNHLVNYFGSKKKTVSLDEAIGIVKECHIQEDIQQNELIGNILHLVEKLPDAQREIVLMRYVNDLDNREIAEALGKEEGAVRTALSRAVAALRDQYNKHHSSHEPHD